MSVMSSPTGVAVPSPPTHNPRGAPTVLSAAARRTPRLARLLAAAHSGLFLRTGGLAGANWFGMPILVLETVGRRSGMRRSNPVVYLSAGDNLVVVAARSVSGSGDSSPTAPPSSTTRPSRRDASLWSSWPR